MVALVRDEREANFLRVQIAYKRVCDVEREIIAIWRLRPLGIGISQEWLRQFAESNAAALKAHRKMAAALRNYSRELASC
jgi:hypothetical protein